MQFGLELIVFPPAHSPGSTNPVTTPLQMADTNGRTKKGACVGTIVKTIFMTAAGINEASAN